MDGHIVVGMGQVGNPLFFLLKSAHRETVGYDKSFDTLAFAESMLGQYAVMHVCFPYSPDFVAEVVRYQKLIRPSLTIIHSTVPIGTTALIPDAVHSPVLGDHSNMLKSLTSFTKWVGGVRAREASESLEKAGFTCRLVEKAETTEALKLMCLAKYGMSIAFAQYQKDICDQLEVSYELITEWDKNYNAFVQPDKQRPLIDPPDNVIGGHCVIPGTAMLAKRFPHSFLNQVLDFQNGKHYKAWPPCNIYPSASIGQEVSIGAFSEIGHNVVIGDRVRIGAMCFLPEGITLEDDVWLGPRVTFTNDRYPPSSREQWENTLVRFRARLGAGVTVLPGITIGSDALVGAGSVVCANIPQGETWYGNPARKQA